jgi:hypothetical protein
MADELQKLILDVQGRDKVAALNEELAKESKALQALAADLRNGSISQATFDAAADATGKKVLALEGQIKQLVGQRGISGSGILQASWAVQDFTSVLAGGQGLGRAIASVQNNIPGLLMSLGMSGGIAGAVSLVSVGIGALIPLLEKLWAGFEDKGVLEEAKRKLQEIKAAAEATHKAFRNMAETPTDPEALSAEGISLVLKERPNAEKAKAAVAAGITEQEAVSAMDPEEQKQYKELQKTAMGVQEDIARRGGDVATEDVIRLRKWAAERGKLVDAARSRKAESIVTGATVAGPAGADARKRLLELTQGDPALKALQDMTPEKIERAEREAEEQDKQAEAEEEVVRKFRAARAKANEKKKFHVQLKKGQTEAALAKNAAAIKEQQAAANAEVHGLEHDFAGTGDEFRAADQERQGQRFDQARQLGIRVAGAYGNRGANAPTKDQADDLARDILRNMEEGLNASQAAQIAVLHKMQQIAAAQQRFTQTLQAQAARAQQFNMGVDQSGVFSLLPPQW